MSEKNPNTTVTEPQVGIGPSEITGLLTGLGGLLTLFFGDDWGISSAAQPIGLVVAGLVVGAVALARAWKHRSLVEAETALRQLEMQLAHDWKMASGRDAESSTEPSTPSS